RLRERHPGNWQQASRTLSARLWRLLTSRFDRPSMRTSPSAPLITPLISASQLRRSAVAAVMPPNPSILQVVSAPASAVSASVVSEQAPASGGVPAGTQAPVPTVLRAAPARVTTSAEA